MRFIGTVVYSKRWDHVGQNDEGSPSSPDVTDVRLDGKVSGHNCYMEISIPSHQAKSYPVGRRVVLDIRPA